MDDLEYPIPLPINWQPQSFVRPISPEVALMAALIPSSAAVFCHQRRGTRLAALEAVQRESKTSVEVPRG